MLAPFLMPCKDTVPCIPDVRRTAGEDKVNRFHGIQLIFRHHPVVGPSSLAPTNPLRW